MKKLLYILVFCGIASQAYGTGSRNLMLMMNWTDETLNDGEQFGALSQVTITALEQKAGPIIITSQTWRSIMGRGTNARYPDYNLSRAVFYQSNATFKYADWIVKKLSDYLYLFVPKSYLASVRARKDSYNQNLNTMTVLTQDDRDLGMKISKFPDISFNDLFNVGYHKSVIPVDTYQNNIRKNAYTTMQQLIASGNTDIAELYYFSQHVLFMLGKLLITRADVISKVDPRQNPALFKEETERHEALLLHEWLVYLDGHGSPSDTGQIQPIIINRPGYYPGPGNIGVTAGLEHNSLQQMLKFFNGSVVTGAMLYASCFAGGPHLSKLYEKEWDAFLRNPQKQVKKDSYNYLILTTNIWYTATMSAVLDYVQFPAFFTSLNAFLHGKYQSNKPAIKYVKGKPKQPVKKKSTFEITAQLAAIIRNVSEFDLARRFQVPGVRFPYTEWFVAIDDPTLPIIFEKSNNRMVQNTTKFVKAKKTSALQAAIQKKLGIQLQLKAAKQEPALVAQSEQRRQDLEAQRKAEEKAKSEQLYTGIMKLQQIQKETTPVITWPPVWTPVQQNIPVVNPAVISPQGPKPTVTTQPVYQQPALASQKAQNLLNAIKGLTNALKQLESQLLYRPAVQLPNQPQPYYPPYQQVQQQPQQPQGEQYYYQPQQYQQQEPQEGQEYYEDEDQEPEGDYYYDDENEEGDYYPEGDDYYYDDDGSYSDDYY